MRILQIAFIALTMVPVFAQSPKSTGTVTTTASEFTIPLERQASFGRFELSVEIEVNKTAGAKKHTRHEKQTKSLPVSYCSQAK